MSYLENIVGNQGEYVDRYLELQVMEALKTYLTSGVEVQVDYQKFYLYSIVTHSTAIEGSTVTEIENHLLFDEGIAAKGRSLTEQMMNVDLKDAYLHAFKIASENPTHSPRLLQQLSALAMRRTGSEYSTIAGQFDSSKRCLVRSSTSISRKAPNPL